MRLVLRIQIGCRPVTISLCFRGCNIPIPYSFLWLKTEVLNLPTQPYVIIYDDIKQAFVYRQMSVPSYVESPPGRLRAAQETRISLMDPLV